MNDPEHMVREYPAHEMGALGSAGKRTITRGFGRLMLLALVLAPFALAFAPWQQNLPGTGRVIEYDPIHRPLPIQARTDGLLARWHVREGQQVALGDPIVDLTDNDPDVIERLTRQLEAASDKRAAAERKRDQYAKQVETAEQARQAAIRLADDDIAAAEQSLVVAKQAVRVAREKLDLANTAETMWEGLVAEKIGAGFELQKAKQERAVADADLEAKIAGVSGAEAALRAKRSARDRVEQAELVKVQDARAKLEAAEGDIASANSTVLDYERSLARQRQQRITAPTDGYVQNLNANGQGGVFVKQGTTLATIVPATRQLAVELFVDGNDVTFIDVGRHVRLQFEGWPAIQWVGWPSAAVGTFGGKVAFVDRFDDGTGRFRVMVTRDERPFSKPEGAFVEWLRRTFTIDNVHAPENPHAWPKDPYLRQGVRVKGWIVLDRVSLGFEIWRQLNGFPPTVERPKNAKPSGGK
ncbi:MAG: HlyD family efflux transporter periplasmic adaptor subunit [Planctomycetes bacterium]|nr:HlyD family efflux transporter periplasmic adaptor subunit [Planctomycetota bacterium]